MSNFIVASLVAITVCGSAGALLAWLVVSWLGIEGTVVGALVAALLGTVIATAAFVAIIVLLRAWGSRKRGNARSRRSLPG